MNGGRSAALPSSCGKTSVMRTKPSTRAMTSWSKTDSVKRTAGSEFT